MHAQEKYTLQWEKCNHSMQECVNTFLAIDYVFLVPDNTKMSQTYTILPLCYDPYS